MDEKIMLCFPWAPDMVHYTAYKFGICELCEKKKKEYDEWNNDECPHCKELTRIMSGVFKSTI